MWTPNLLKKAALVLAVLALALTWSPNGQCGPNGCTVERGIDPLDVVNDGVRHNVWILLDTSRSMRFDWQGHDIGSLLFSAPSRLDTAKDILSELILSTLVEPTTGDPYVNWGFVAFDYNLAYHNQQPLMCQKTSVYDSTDMCVGLDWSVYEGPPLCGGQDNRQGVVDTIQALTPQQSTPNGISVHQLAKKIASTPEYTIGRYPGQKNFIIMVTDGDDTCECDASFWDDGVSTWDATTPRYLRSESLTSDPTHQAASYTTTTHDDCSLTGWFNNDDCLQQQNEYDRQAWNAAVKAKEAYQILNTGSGGEDWTVNAGAGSIFTIGLGLRTESMRRGNHFAWEASGASFGNPYGEPALFANNPDELKQRLLDVFAKIGVPETEVNLGTSVVGSVKELIPKIPGLRVRDPEDANIVRAVTPDDILGDVEHNDLNDVTFARRLRSQLRNNVMLNSSFDLPGFRGHLKAYNVYRVQNFENDNGIRYPDYQTDFYNTDPDFNSCDEPGCFWDAGALLQDRYAFDRTILFHRKGDLPGTEPREFCHIHAPGCGSTTVTAADLGLIHQDLHDLHVWNYDDAVEVVVRIVRGENLSVHPVTKTFYRPFSEGGGLNFSDHVLDKNGNYQGVWKLWDPINVGATVVQNPPRSPDKDPPPNHAYEFGAGNFPDGFYWENLNRETLVYLPTNSGLIHAFRAVNGQELFAYIPPDVLGTYEATEIAGSRNTLKNFVKQVVRQSNGVINHVFLLSSAATAEDVFLRSDYGWEDCGNGGCWHTALVFGRGKGGKFITALDVTLNRFGQSLDWDGTYYNTTRLDVNTDPLPRLMFNVGNRQGVADYDGLGETWSVPVMGNIATADGDQWVAFAGAGYGCSDPTTHEGQFLYVLRMEDGAVYQLYRIPNDPAAPVKWNGLVATPTLYNPHQLDPYDQQDYVTQIYFGDLQGKVYKIPMTGTQNPNSVDVQPWYSIGSDQPITVSGALFKDQVDVLVFFGTGGDYRAGGVFKLVALNDLGGTSTQGTEIWTMDLVNGQRVVAPPVVGGETIFFAGTRSDLDVGVCRVRFWSALYGVHVSTGLGTFDLDPGTAGEQDNMDLGEGKVTGMFFRDGQLYVSRSGAIGLSGDTLVLGDDDGQNMNDMVPGFAGTVQILVRGFRMSPF